MNGGSLFLFSKGSWEWEFVLRHERMSNTVQSIYLGEKTESNPIENTVDCVQSNYKQENMIIKEFTLILDYAMILSNYFIRILNNEKSNFLILKHSFFFFFFKTKINWQLILIFQLTDLDYPSFCNHHHLY